MESAMRVIFVLLLVAFASASDNQTTPLPDQYEPDNIITNGYSPYVGKVPYIVGLVLKYDYSDYESLCSGSIISPFWVLTAAQCLVSHYVDIHYGANYRSNGQYYHSVRNNNFRRHHLWPDTFGHDIGLILTPYVAFTARVNKVSLPSFNLQRERHENKWAVTCGWGRQADGQLADWLQCVDLQIISNNECAKAYGPLPTSVLCVRTQDGKSTCDEDYGGPLVTHGEPPILVGITSFGPAEECMAGHPAGFTRVNSHLDWIRMHTGIAYY